MSAPAATGQTLLVLASTYPRWRGDPEPGFVHELAKRLAPHLHVIVLCPHAAGAAPVERMDGVEVIRYRYAPARLETLVNNGGIVTNLRNSRWKALLLPGFVLSQAWQAWRLCRTRKIDVVHAHWLVPQGLIAVLLGSALGGHVPFVVTSHGADLYALRGRAMRALKRFVLARAHSATVVSHAMRDAAMQLGTQTSISVLPMGVDTAARFVLGDPRARNRDELLFVGRLVEKKGVRHLLDALPLVLRERPCVTLTIAGFGPDEPLLRIRVHELGLQHAVHFLGAVPQERLPALYQRAALFVAPFVQAASGDQEGLPVALMEAVACGCPAIAGDVAGLQDIFGPQASTCIVNPRDGAAMASAILARLEDPHQASESAQELRATLLGRLGWEHIAEQYLRILENAAGHPRQAPPR